MSSRLKIEMGLCIAIVILILSNLAIGKSLFDSKENNKITTQYLSEALVRAESSEIKQSELNNKIEDLIADNSLLEKNLKDLKAKPTSVQTITITLPGEETILVGAFPEQYKYVLTNGLPVAEHTYKDNQFIAKTYDIGLNLTIILASDKEGKQTSYVDSYITSSGTDEQFPIQANSKLLYITPHKVFRLLDPHTNLGISFSLPTMKPRASLGVSLASIGTTKLDNSYRFGNIKLETGNDFALGIDPVSINISKLAHIPLIQDTWLAAGVDYVLLPSYKPLVVTFSITSTL